MTTQDMAGELDVAINRYLSDARQAEDPLACPLLADDLNGHAARLIG
jgi:hypothetical protein